MNMKLEGLIFGILAILTIASIVVSLSSLIKVRRFQDEIENIHGKKEKKILNNQNIDNKRKKRPAKNKNLR